jgi:hypothetical protein
MTRPRYDSHSTEFGLWLREQEEIDSKEGFVTTNIDYLWSNYKIGLWMLIEEKRYNSKPSKPQHNLFQIINKAAWNDPNYKGMHLLVFENTSPDDGKIFLDKQEITKEELIKFLKFQL